MPITDLPILSMLRSKMSWAQERQKVLSENVANADTPNYRGRDVVAPTFEDAVAAAQPVAPVTLAATAPGHIGGTPMAGDSTFRTQKGGYEIRPTGNSVNLEDEMIKVADNQMEYQTAAAIYSRSLALIKVAIGKS